MYTDTPDYSTIDMIVKSLAADYERRADAIAKNELDPKVLMEYRYYNTKMFNAAAEIVGEKEAERYIYDIGNGKGYPKDEAIYISEPLYYKRKLACKRSIARALNLM